MINSLKKILNKIHQNNKNRKILRALISKKKINKIKVKVVKWNHKTINRSNDYQY